MTKTNRMASKQPTKQSVPLSVGKIDSYWSPKIIASLNDAYEVKISKFSGEFIWHSHPDTDELFYIIKGKVLIRLNEPGQNSGLEDVYLDEGDIFVVPKGVMHCPAVVDNGDGTGEAVVMLMEPTGVVNTGNRGFVQGRTNEVGDLRLK